MTTIHNFKVEPYRFLGNFYYFTVRNPHDDDDLLYPTVEHAYQAAKSLDMYDRMIIRDAASPALAKELGRAVLLRPDWEAIKRIIMLDILRDKFAIDRTLAPKLLATRSATLVEGNDWHDNYWGVCTCTICRYERSREESNLGMNWLGKLLMLVRTELEVHPRATLLQIPLLTKQKTGV